MNCCSLSSMEVAAVVVLDVLVVVDIDANAKTSFFVFEESDMVNELSFDHIIKPRRSYVADLIVVSSLQCTCNEPNTAILVDEMVKYCRAWQHCTCVWLEMEILRRKVELLTSHTLQKNTSFLLLMTLENVRPLPLYSFLDCHLLMIR